MSKRAQQQALFSSSSSDAEPDEGRPVEDDEFLGDLLVEGSSRRLTTRDADDEGLGYGAPSDEDDDEDQEGGSDDDDDDGGGEGDDDDPNLLPVEREAARLRKKQKKARAEGEAELQLNLEERERYALPDEEQLEQEQREPLRLQEVLARIQEVLRVLGNFAAERDPERSREDYMSQLKRDLGFYYACNAFLVNQVLRLFSPTEAVEFFEANERPRPVTIRCNTLKARRRDLAQALIARGINLDPVGDWSKVGLQVFESTVPIGATPEYLAGHYMLQGAASLLPVMALGARPDERILDMCAAPGGKTTHIAQDMKNKGTLFANDCNRERIAALSSNIHRMGVTNCIVTNLDGKEFPKVAGGFDRVLLDAPCSGLGVISRDSRIKVSKTVSDIHLCRNLQKELILHAIDSVNASSKTGGIIIYCTCTISVEENELVVQHALDNRDVVLVDTGLTFGKPGYVKYEKYRMHPSMALCRRFYPHVHNTDGFFVAKLVKRSNKIRQDVKEFEQARQQQKTVAEEKRKKQQKLKRMRKAIRLGTLGQGKKRKHKQADGDGDGDNGEDGAEPDQAE